MKAVVGSAVKVPGEALAAGLVAALVVAVRESALGVVGKEVSCSRRRKTRSRH